MFAIAFSLYQTSPYFLSVPTLVTRLVPALQWMLMLLPDSWMSVSRDALLNMSVVD
jgi:hypothetical protein